MTPAARISAAIEVVADIEARRRPANDALRDWGVGHRFAGSGDRAAIAGLVYDALRRKASSAFVMGSDSARAVVFGMLRLARHHDLAAIERLADGSRFAPAALSDEERAGLASGSLDGAPDHVRGDYPDWLDPYLDTSFGAARAEEGAALAYRATLDLRVNTLKGSRADALAKLEHLGAAETRWSPIGLRLDVPASAKSPPVQSEPAFLEGLIEIQDEGSQLAALLADAKSGETVVDLCAGGGGKTLALAAAMGNGGKIFSTDLDIRRLAPIHDRLARAGVTIVAVRTPRDRPGAKRGEDDALADLRGQADLVLIDAPCTGTGVWRRNPDAKWRIRPGALEQRVKEQAEILDRAAGLVKPGGRIVYVTCSVLSEENAGQVRAFTGRHDGWTVVAPAEVAAALGPSADAFRAAALLSAEGIQMTPRRTGTDGFFVGVLRRAEGLRLWVAAAGRPESIVSAARIAICTPMHDKILIVDFGSQVTQLIARRVREEGVYSEVVPYQKAEAAFAEMKPKAVILSGGPASVLDDNAPVLPASLYAKGVPMLGICYGEQAMAQQLGGKVEAGHHREFGRAEVEITEETALTKGVWRPGEKYPVWMSHGDRVTKLPDGFRIIGTSANAPIALIADEQRKFYGAQFHLEVVHTPHGAALLRNFVRDIAGCTGDWTMRAFKDEAIEKIRKQVGKGRVICGLSGGVDSAVAAVLIHEAIGDQLTCVLVDHGLMRMAEASRVVTLFRDSYNIPLVHVDASEMFLGALAGVTDPEVKRKTIGKLFIDVFEAEAKKVGGADFLAQGTLYPDVIESVSFTGGPSVTIKSHHNVGGLPARMNMQLVEPLRELFKDEVRALGRELGLPDVFVGRHPFPGPGLAIRCPGEITREKLDILRLADEIYIEEIRRAGLYDDIWQAFAVLLPVKTVGVMGDGRTYEFVVGLRAVTSTDGMTADFYPYDMKFLGHVATRIINEVKGVNRVVYDVTSKPPGTIEWE